MLEFPCWNCGKTLKARQEHAGKKCKCTQCNNANQIPGVQFNQSSNDESNKLEPDLSANIVEWNQSDANLESHEASKERIEIVERYRTHPIYILLAVLGIFSTIVACYLWFSMRNAPSVLKSDPKDVVRYDTYLLYSDEQIATVLESQSVEGIERLYFDWIPYQETLRNPVDIRKGLKIQAEITKHYNARVPEERRKNPIK